MNSHFITLFIRRRLNNKLMAGVGLLNLTAGFTAFVLISLFLQYHLNYDRHNALYDRIYRLQLHMSAEIIPNPHTHSVTAALARHVLAPLPEVERTAVIHSAGDDNINGYFFSIDRSRPVMLKQGYFSDPEIFDIFTFRFIDGSAQEALARPGSLVLSRSSAEKFFPEGSALGKVLSVENKKPMTITGIYQDFPKNSDWRPEFLIPMENYTEFTGIEDFEDNYWMYSFGTFVLLKENASYTSVNDKIHDALKETRETHHPYLRPLSKVHMNPFFQPDMMIAIGLFFFIALLILVLTCVNYINLQTADAGSRMKEIGIKKSVGYSHRELWKQYMGESVMEAAACAVLALGIVHYCMPLYHRILGEDLGLSVFKNLQLIGLILAVAIGSGFFSALYPAFTISRFSPVKALRQRFAAIERNGISLKKVLVTIQFSISLFLVIVSFIVFNQANYMINKEMGFDKSNLLTANIKTYCTGSFEPVRQRLLEHPEILNACFSDYIPFILSGGNEMTWEGGLPDEKAFVRINNINHDFLNTYGIRIAEGRAFSREHTSDIDKCLVNEAAVRVFGWENPIGMKIRSWDKDREVIGVVEDYVLQSVHNPIEPQTFRLLGDSVSLTGMYSIRYASGKKAEAEKIAENIFEEFYPQDAFYFESFENHILSEGATRIWGVFRNITFTFAAFSILISSVGLFGLVLFYCRKKMKEIGIRKIVGFSVARLYLKLVGEFLVLIIIGVVFSWAGAWFVYDKLPGASKYELQLTEFLAGTAIILVVALVTISYNILLAARTSPAGILKYE
jgi:putative ABC transport system permease protein